MKTTGLKKFPPLNTDEEAEAFLENEDLSEYDWSGFRKVYFEFEPKLEDANLKLPEKLIVALKEKAETLGLPYNQFVAQILEQAIVN